MVEAARTGHGVRRTAEDLLSQDEPGPLPYGRPAPVPGPSSEVCRRTGARATDCK